MKHLNNIFSSWINSRN